MATESISLQQRKQLEEHIAADPALRALWIEKKQTERELRRMLCQAIGGVTAYMDDGEAQDNSMQPCIDFMRMTPAEIQSLLVQRGYKRLVDAVDMFEKGWRAGVASTGEGCNGEYGLEDPEEVNERLAKSRKETLGC